MKDLPAFFLRRESACSKASSVPLINENLSNDLVGFFLFIFCCSVALVELFAIII